MIVRKPDGYNQLLVYRRAEELRIYTQKLTEKMPYSEKRRKVHMNDSARSVKQNIVEGWKRSTTKEYYEFLSFSLGSLAELKEDIKDIREDKIISEKTFELLTDKCKELDFLLNRLRQSLYDKMEREHSLPAREKYQNFFNQKEEDEDILNKIMAEHGVERLPDGRCISRDRGEKGDKGETGQKGQPI